MDTPEEPPPLEHAAQGSEEEVALANVLHLQAQQMQALAATCSLQPSQVLQTYPLGSSEVQRAATVQRVSGSRQARKEKSSTMGTL